jgi:hypothetical protein
MVGRGVVMLRKEFVTWLTTVFYVVPHRPENLLEPMERCADGAWPYADGVTLVGANPEILEKIVRPNLPDLGATLVDATVFFDVKTQTTEVFDDWWNATHE